MEYDNRPKIRKKGGAGEDNAGEEFLESIAVPSVEETVSKMDKVLAKRHATIAKLQERKAALEKEIAENKQVADQQSKNKELDKLEKILAQMMSKQMRGQGVCGCFKK